MSKVMLRILCSLFVVALMGACKPERRPPVLPRNANVTPIPGLVSGEKTTTNSSNSSNAFHLNFALDESVGCSISTKCDFAFLPKFTVYFRGDTNSGKNGDVSGDGQIVILSTEACQTLIPGTSSCQVLGVTNGSFSITGNLEGSQLHLILHLEEMPSLKVNWTTKSPSGDVVMDLTTTYNEEMKKVFENAGILEKEFQVESAISTTTAAKVFEGSYTFGGTRTLHGFGGLFLIDPTTALPQAFTP
ncbi:MAG: hypothetical protein NTZ74_11865 [Chloroflexi bacterium]|nr:hypothetical protein [Chloroflexota bacterium]